jgi:hypothetical protein
MAPFRGAVVGYTSANMQADTDMINFFQVARNCIVHRSNRASKKLAEIGASNELKAALQSWPGGMSFP